MRYATCLMSNSEMGSPVVAGVIGDQAMGQSVWMHNEFEFELYCTELYQSGLQIGPIMAISEDKMQIKCRVLTMR